MCYGIPGPGRWLTIYANPSHVYAVIAGLRWDTVGDARGSGPRWHPYDAYPRASSPGTSRASDQSFRAGFDWRI